jgi:hypothetical protein
MSNEKITKAQKNNWVLTEDKTLFGEPVYLTQDGRRVDKRGIPMNGQPGQRDYVLDQYKNDPRLRAGTQLGGNEEVRAGALRTFNESPYFNPPPSPDNDNKSETPTPARPEGYTQKKIQDPKKEKIKAGQLDNDLPGWWDYMKQTHGGEVGAISRIADDAVRDLGSRLSRGAAGATGGKYGNANAQGREDAFGMKSYGELQNNFIKDQQEINKEEVLMNMKEDSFWNVHKRDLQKMGISQEQAKELQAIANQHGHDMATMQMAMTEKLTKWGLGAGMINSLLNILGIILSEGGYTGRGGKHEPAGTVHKGEYVIPKKNVDQRTGLPKLERIMRWGWK